MKQLKPVTISILALIVFAVALWGGMQTEWWQLDGRRTPLDSYGGGQGHESVIDSIEDEHTEEEHEDTVISGSSTIQQALDLGLTYEQLATVLGGSVRDMRTDTFIKDIITERGLKFGIAKDELNKRIP